MEGSDRGMFKVVLSQNLFVGTEENHRNLSQGRQFLGRDFCFQR
jgi:hypothetical protein